MKRIKVYNMTNHGHSVRMVLDNGKYTYRRLAKKGNFAIMTEEQFLDLWMNSKDFKSGKLSFNEKDLSDDVKMDLGLPITEEEAENFVPEFKIYKDDEITALIKGQMGAFKGFMKEIRELTPDLGDELKRRVFAIAREMENLNRTKADIIEETTGFDFKVNDQNDEQNPKK